MSNLSDDNSPRRYNHINDLKDHRFFRHVVDILKNHPYSSDLIALHAAVLVDGSRIISVGYNKPYKPQIVRNIKNAHPNLSLHAEVSAIKNSHREDLKDSTLYVARLFKDKQTIGLSKPCKYCQRVLLDFNIRKVIFTTETGELNSIKPYTNGAFDL